MVTSDWLEAQNAAIGCILVDPTLAAELLSETTKEDFSGAALAAYEVISQVFAAGQHPQTRYWWRRDWDRNTVTI